MKKILILSPLHESSGRIQEAIRNAAREASVSAAVADEVQCFHIDAYQSLGTIIEAIWQSVQEADVVIADFSESNPNVSYEVGYAHALKKPTIHIRRKMENIAFDIQSLRFLYYTDGIDKMNEFTHELIVALVSALTNPEKWTATGYAGEEPATKPTVFISYCHTDLDYLKRLQIHLRPLEKENVIDLWDDTKIKAGSKWRKEIERALDRAGIAILLISADFLASDFIVDNELPPLLKTAEQKGAIILPVIIKPCRFARDKNLSQFQAINNPARPIQGLSEVEQEELYARICERVEQEGKRGQIYG